MSHYTLVHLEDAPRHELHDLLQLTAAEVSLNTLPAGGAVPFVHRHQKNEEVYLMLDGRGMLYIDGEELPLKGGTASALTRRGRVVCGLPMTARFPLFVCRPGPAVWKALP